MVYCEIVLLVIDISMFQILSYNVAVFEITQYYSNLYKHKVPYIKIP